MRTKSYRCAVVLAGCCLAMTASADLLLSDFNGTGLDFTYGSWSGVGAVATGPTYLTIDDPATPSGGGGVSSLGLLFDAGTYSVALTARLGLANEGTAINVVLVDADPSGVETFAYFFAASGFNSSTFTTVNLPATNWGFHAVQSGTPDGVLNPDLSGSVTGWQLQGNYANDVDTVNFEVDHLALVVPEPGTLVLGSLGLGVALLVRRLKRNV